MLSALMITGKTPLHRRLAGVAVRCFLEQTLPEAERELVVINTAVDAPWFGSGGVDHPPYGGGTASSPKEFTWAGNVREVCFPQRRMKLGGLRNVSQDQARGELTIQWDDDDWHHPTRMKWQLETWTSGAGILRRQYRLNIRTGLWGILNAHGWPNRGIVGTVICPRNAHKYPPAARGEDGIFIRRFHRIQSMDNPPELYVRTYHGNNTWDRRKVMKPVRKGRKRYVGDRKFIEPILELYQRATS